MKCGKCGHGNAAETKYCTACGASLTRASGADRPQKGKGRSAKLKRAASRSRSGVARRGSNRRGLVVVAALAGVALLAVVVRRDGPGLEASGRLPAAGSGLAASPAVAFASVSLAGGVQAVAEKFWCSCSSCDVPELSDCTCPTALEEKRFIEDQLDGGASQIEAVRAIERRYGGLKKRFAALVREPASAATATAALDAGPVEAPAPAASMAVSTSVVAVAADGSRIATLADTTAVARRFSCACGSCGEMVLATCDCSHKRGAAEMKAFIAYKIQQQLSMDDVVEAVAYEYGHLISLGEEGGT